MLCAELHFCLNNDNHKYKQKTKKKTITAPLQRHSKYSRDMYIVYSRNI